jgi:hypothetical protein
VEVVEIRSLILHLQDLQQGVLLLLVAVVGTGLLAQVATVFQEAPAEEPVGQVLQYIQVVRGCLGRVMLVALQIRQERIQQVEQVAVLLGQLV